jgi:hypothetical protein
MWLHSTVEAFRATGRAHEGRTFFRRFEKIRTESRVSGFGGTVDSFGEIFTMSVPLQPEVWA